MLNPRLDILGPGPFQRLAALLDPLAPAPGLEPLNMALGEPQRAYPDFVADIIDANRHLYGRYPPQKASPELRRANLSWLEKRYGLASGRLDAERHVIPVHGTREGLFMMALTVVPPRVRGRKPAVLMPNPFYHCYAGAAISAGADPVFVPAVRETGFLPDFHALDADTLARTALCYLCSPANPQGAIADRGYLERLIGLAREYDFVLLVDECYAEIYDKHPPPGALEVALASEGEGSLDNVVVFHSLSKRSSVPGLRSGFAAGDPTILERFFRLRTYGGPFMALPADAAAAALWLDEDHVGPTRDFYRGLFDLAEKHLGGHPGFRRPAGGFFLWLEVGDSEAVAAALWQRAAVRSLPGAYLGRVGPEGNPGLGYLRLALVHPPEISDEALSRIARVL